MNSFGATLTLFFALIVLFAPRSWAALGVIGGVCYVTQGQQIYTLGFHFTAIRIILLAGFIRCLVRGELNGLKFDAIGKAVIGYALAEFFINIARERSHQTLVYMLGGTFDISLSYFVMRSLIASVEDARTFLRKLPLFIIPFALLMVWESATGNNVFRVMGGQGWDTNYFRDGKVRCVASFRGPHTAGIFGATLIPLFFALWFGNGSRLVAVMGIVAGVLIMFTSNSSGPLTACVSGVIGLLFWRFREDMSTVRRGIVVTLIALHLVMKAPVWFLFMKVSNILGGDGYTRSYVIDQALRHFSEWWLLGTTNTIRWFDPGATGELDLTDQFVASGICGGLLSLVFFILIFVRSYRQLGLALKVARGHSFETEVLLWCMGSTLFAHVMGQFTVGYFDQIHAAWWGFIAIISGVTSDVLHRAPISVVSDAREEATATVEMSAEPTT